MNATLEEIIIQWTLAGAAVLIMLMRLALKIRQHKKIDLGEYFTIAAIFSLLLRCAVEHVVMVWGSNTTITAKQRATKHFTAEELYCIETASKLLIVNRVMYTVYVWLQKAVVMMMLERLLRGLRFDKILTACWVMLAITFIPTVIMCFTECHPIQKYWQVFPDPGTCANGDNQLLVFEILNMVTDTMLMVLPLKHLANIQRPLMAKLRIVSIFMVGLTLIAISLIRVLGNYFSFHRTGNSHDVANAELFIAAFVANAPTIYGLINMKYGAGSSKQSYGNPYGNSGYLRNGTAGESQVDATATIRPAAVSRNRGVWAKQNGEFESDEELIMEMPNRYSPYKARDIHVTTTFDVGRGYNAN